LRAAGPLDPATKEKNATATIAPLAAAPKFPLKTRQNTGKEISIGRFFSRPSQGIAPSKSLRSRTNLARCDNLHFYRRTFHVI
jgi:hypothetical protein